MLTDRDINKIISVVATKEDIGRLEIRMGTFEETQRRILGALDRLATTIKELNLEYAAMGEQLTRHERWIKQIAKQAGISLKE